MSALKIRAGQREFERGIEMHRIVGFLTRRQYGKTTEAARIALKKMMKRAGHTVVFGSVKLDLGREITRKEAEQMQKAFALLSGQAKSVMLKTADAKNGMEAELKPDDFAELYEACRLEFRLYHSRSVYSRTKVVALTPDAVGETGDLILDEVGRVKKFREVWEAVKPIISSQPEFRCALTTTPPPDDSHYSFELLAPPIGQEFPVRPEGNWYRSELGVWVLRVTAWDAYADGVRLYDDDTGEPVSPEESRRREPDKDAWDRNYGVKFVFGGTAAVPLLVLDACQKRGAPGGESPCGFWQVESDLAVDRAAAWLSDNLGTGAVGVGWDLATTESESSNPSALAVCEQVGLESVFRAILVWKTCDPAVADERVKRILAAIKARPAGGRARRLCIDATNERYFATQMQTSLRGECPVELVIGSQVIERPGSDPMKFKQFLGARLCGRLEDNRAALPPDRYVREDFRLVKRDRGSFVCEPDPQGRHGDTFDACKLADWALESAGGAIVSMEGVKSGGGPGRHFAPRLRSRL